MASWMRNPLSQRTLSVNCGTGRLAIECSYLLEDGSVFGVCNEQGQPLAWVGRNVKYEDELTAWEACGRRGDEPTKYRFPTAKHFRRGLELYGVEWLADPRFAKSLARHGLLVVEGFTDRLRLHELGVASVALMSNRITDEQTERLIDLANRCAGGRIGVFLDADEKGDDGAKDLLWKLQERGPPAGWSGAAAATARNIRTGSPSRSRPRNGPP
ncbi:MAG: toprim domain-containing protein [Pirellulales bacterium]|nr:toprim domain-containing protein [Pirellulales bacterium]